MGDGAGNVKDTAFSLLSYQAHVVKKMYGGMREVGAEGDIGGADCRFERLYRM